MYGNVKPIIFDKKLLKHLLSFQQQLRNFWSVILTLHLFIVKNSCQNKFFMVFILLSLLYTDWTTTDNFIEKSQKLKSLWQSTHRDGLMQISPL